MFSTTAAPSPRAHPPRSAAFPKSSRPISAPRWPPMLRIEAIEVHYGAVVALRDVSLEVARGELVALIGANGAGKTTTLSTIIGVMRPTRGRIVFLDEDITGLPP